MSAPDKEQRLDAPPPYRPSIDKIFLDKLSDSDRYLVTKLDQVDQRIEWLIVVALSSHNRGVDLGVSLQKLEERVRKLEEENPEEDRTLLKWVRENVVAPAKIVGWVITASAGALIYLLIEKFLNK